MCVFLSLRWSSFVVLLLYFDISMPTAAAKLRLFRDVGLRSCIVVNVAVHLCSIKAYVFVLAFHLRHVLSTLSY